MPYFASSPTAVKKVFTIWVGWAESRTQGISGIIWVMINSLNPKIIRCSCFKINIILCVYWLKQPFFIKLLLNSRCWSSILEADGLVLKHQGIHSHNAYPHLITCPKYYRSLLRANIQHSTVPLTLVVSSRNGIHLHASISCQNIIIKDEQLTVMTVLINMCW